MKFTNSDKGFGVKKKNDAEDWNPIQILLQQIHTVWILQKIIENKTKYEGGNQQVLLLCWAIQLENNIYLNCWTNFTTGLKLWNQICVNIIKQILNIKQN